MSKSIFIAAELDISSDTHQIHILSDSQEIGISITGESIPRLGISSFKLLKLLRNIPPIEMDQKITLVFNKKEIYRSDKSLFKQSTIFLIARIFLKNLF